jgi:hypothetical protein
VGNSLTEEVAERAGQKPTRCVKGLAARLKITRNTARAALRKLRAEGLLDELYCPVLPVPEDKRGWFLWPDPEKSRKVGDWPEKAAEVGFCKTFCNTIKNYDPEVDWPSYVETAAKVAKKTGYGYGEWVKVVEQKLTRHLKQGGWAIGVYQDFLNQLCSLVRYAEEANRERGRTYANGFLLWRKMVDEWLPFSER